MRPHVVKSHGESFFLSGSVLGVGALAGTPKVAMLVDIAHERAIYTKVHAPDFDAGGIAFGAADFFALYVALILERGGEDAEAINLDRIAPAGVPLYVFDEGIEDALDFSEAERAVVRDVSGNAVEVDLVFDNELRIENSLAVAAQVGHFLHDVVSHIAVLLVV